MPTDKESGERRHARVRYDAGKVSLRTSKANPFISGALLDISVSGCLIKTVEEITVNPDDVVELRIDLSTLAFRALGYVRRASSGTQSLGIEFHRVAEQDKSDLEILIDFYAEA